MTRMAEVLDRLSPEQRRLLLRRLSEESSRGGTATATAEEAAGADDRIRPRDKSQPAPLSFAQQRLWFLEQLDPDSGSYNLGNGLELRGRLDLAALTAVVAELADRHETLRTTFQVPAGASEPVQVVAPRLALTIPVVDLRALAEADRDGVMPGMLTAVLGRPYDLARGPLVRLVALRPAARRHVLAVGMHHVISDGWSFGLFTREVSLLYQAFLDGRPSPLPPLPVQYADFAVWQRRLLAEDGLASLLGFWREALEGAPAAIELPTDRPRPLRRSPWGGQVPVRLSPELTARLEGLGRQQGATLYMVILASYGLLLARLAGQAEVVVGSPVAGRNRSEIEGLIGFFVNAVPLRIRLAGDPGFSELLARVRATVQGAFGHQDLPFERLVEELRPDRDLSQSPIFQVALSFLSTPAGRLEMTGVQLAPVRWASERALFDLTLHLVPWEGQLGGNFEFSRDLFDEPTIVRFLAAWRRLLEGLSEHPERPVSRHSLLSPAETRQLVSEWNDTAVDYGHRGYTHQLVLEQAVRRPDALALSGSGEAWSYGGLVGRARSLAAELAARGVGPEARGVVLAERTDPQRVTAALALMLAGAAYVPLDPSYPAERLAFLLEDAGAPVVLTRRDLLERFPEVAGTLRQAQGGPSVMLLDDVPEVPGTSTKVDPGFHRDDGRGSRCEGQAGWLDGQSLAYVVYTSGSTGKPKGVEIPHEGLLNMVRWHQDYYGVRADDRATQVASPAFDASVWELWPYLAAGASVHIPDEDTRLSAPAMVDWWERERISLAYLPTALVEGVLREAIGPERVLGVRTVIIGGDRLVGRPRPDAPYVLSNTYGPAEYTVLSTAIPIPPRQAGEEGLPSIGWAIANTQLYVVEPGGALAPLGVAGELWVGGIGLARGYLRRPALTAGRFTPHPFSGVPGARVYRTGDRVRRRPDGDLDFLGRFDFQVKIRGFRVELGEIEALLETHPGVGQVAVALKRIGGADGLAAYWVPEGEDGGPSADALRGHVASQLPAYMVPAAFVRLERLPLTSNGKVDRAALPTPIGAAARAFEPPRTLTEAAVAAIWTEVLGVERVGVEDGFFELGGHSLLATRVVSRVREQLGVELPLRRIFEATTVAQLAAAIDGLRAAGEAGDRPAAPPLVPVAREGRLPLSYAQERLWFIDRLAGGTGIYNVPLAVRFHGSLDLGALDRAFRRVFERHEVLRTCFAEEGGVPYQVILPRMPFRVPVVDLAQPAQADADDLAGRLRSRDAGAPFDLLRGPMLRATVLRLGAEEHELLLTQHHLVTDVVAMGLLIDQVGVFYRAEVLGEPVALPELPVQYTDFAVWQRSWLESGELARQLAWWRQRLEGAPTEVDLPTDRPRPPLTSGRGDTRYRMLPEALSERIHELSRRRALTPFMTLTTLWAALLGRLSGQRDLLVGTPVANRSRRELEGLIGFLLNTVVLRADLGGDPTVAETFERMRQVSLEAYTYQDLPFERLIDGLELPRVMDRAPLVQSVVTVRRTDFSTAELPGLTFERVGVQSHGARLDLAAYVAQGPWGFGLGAEYATDPFDATTIERWLRGFESLTRAALEDPERKLWGLPLLSPAEVHQLRVEWNDTEPAHPDLGWPQEMLLTWARCRPDAVAIVGLAEVWSYGYLGRRASALATRLVGLGVGPGVRVALLAERTLPERVLGSVAVLLAGGAYVLLDPSYPLERLAWLLEDAGAPVVLTQCSLLDRLPASPATVLALDAREPLAETGEPPRAELCGDDLAYVVYTSGSTGRPKGVEIAHAGLLRLVHWFHHYYGLGEIDRGSLVVSPGFDAAVLEIWPYLAAGASVHVPAEEERLSPAGTFSWWRQEGITVAVLPTALADGVLREPLAAAEGLALRAVIGGGEKLLGRPATAAPYSLMNAYGPTETTVLSTTSRVKPWGMGEEGAPSVGRPIDGTRLFVVDRAGRLAAVGVAGELLIGGAGVARGYLRRPGLTAERFVPDAFSGLPGQRLYRTGDRVRLRADGELDVLGRFDLQVKLRGMRVELGEIESALERCPGVGEVTVDVRASGSTQRLVAWWVPDQGADGEPAEESLRERLARQLPAYMVPTSFVRLEALPRSAHGKVDRRALPDPEVEVGRAYVAPGNEVEAGLAALVGELLGVERVGVTDDFFALGGHSLLVPRLVARVRERLGLSLRVMDLFQQPTVAGLAALLAARVDGSGAAAVGEDEPVALRAEGEATPLFFVHPVGGTVFAYRALAGHLGGERPFYAFQSRGVMEEATPRRSIEEMAAAYVAALRRVRPDGPYLLGGWSLGGLVAFEMARQLVATGAEVGPLVLIDASPVGTGTGQEVAEVEAMVAWAADLSASSGTPLTVDPAEIVDLDREARVEHLIGRLRTTGVLAGAEAEDLARRALGVFIANVEAFHRYQAGRYEGRIALFWGRGGSFQRDAAPWRALGAEVVEHWHDGDHYTLLQEPTVRALARQLDAVLGRSS